MPLGTVFHEKCKSTILLLEFSAQCCVFELAKEAWTVISSWQQKVIRVVLVTASEYFLRSCGVRRFVFQSRRAQ